MAKTSRLVSLLQIHPADESYGDSSTVLKALNYIKDLDETEDKVDIILLHLKSSRKTNEQVTDEHMTGDRVTELIKSLSQNKAILTTAGKGLSNNFQWI